MQSPQVQRAKGIFCVLGIILVFVIIVSWPYFLRFPEFPVFYLFVCVLLSVFHARSFVQTVHRAGERALESHACVGRFDWWTPCRKTEGNTWLLVWVTPNVIHRSCFPFVQFVSPGRQRSHLAFCGFASVDTLMFQLSLCTSALCFQYSKVTLAIHVSCCLLDKVASELYPEGCLPVSQSCKCRWTRGGRTGEAKRGGEQPSKQRERKWKMH